jgi:hypothetical protein
LEKGEEGCFIAKEKEKKKKRACNTEPKKKEIYTYAQGTMQQSNKPK